MMTNQEMLMAAIEFEEVDVSYDLLYLISNGIIDPNAQYHDLGQTWNKVDAGETRKMMQQNLLGFDEIKLYCVQLNAEDFEIFAARNDNEARGYLLNTYRFIPKFTAMPKEKWDKVFWFEESKSYRSLREIRKNIHEFPSHLMYF